MTHPIVQIYEIQTPEEARKMIALGVDHIGSVVPSQKDRHDPVLQETVATVRKMGAVSSLIPLYNDTDAVLETLDEYRPHIVHFCDHLNSGRERSIEEALALQEAVRRRFPDIRIMRSIPIGRPGMADDQAVLVLAARLEPMSDLFLTDTVLSGTTGSGDTEQPVNGFVGITGLTCDWDVAAKLVTWSRIPVILAGGISPENVAAGVLQVGPFGVDSCTCTNAVDDTGRPIRFKKDPQRVEKLIAETCRAGDKG
ncbi:N-(5'-phosphoribosyl)anthranilate isomerase [Desulfosarcina widdelii]|uniref:N-(5'-phosphoribosyl)anthranilate isomerase n=1 Tax=Desulfosarcina widdelii TaxID=947919 RepID=A0A5K7Z2D1_9BACT|nr:hypothetical protein [Desulfosarcina widdelii]BBO73681.1 N-(5'-phosphoribosyl)anthranilate isomerase [Desulfosarcina widdelii]